MTVLLSAEEVSRRFGSLVALDTVTLQVEEGSVHALIGPNGAGKTTLFNLLSGELAPSSGVVHFAGARIETLGPDARARRGIGRSFQITSVFQSLTVFENVRVAAQAQAAASPYNFFASANKRGEVRRRAGEVLERVGLTRESSLVAGELSHGRQRLLGVALALATRPKLLLLDEPCAGMGVEDIELMIDLLRDLAADHTIVLIEHHVELVMTVSDVVTVLDQGRILLEGSPDEVSRDDRVRQAYLGVQL